MRVLRLSTESPVLPTLARVFESCALTVGSGLNPANLELARMIGHRDIASLMFYYNTTADELADRLG